MAMRRTSARCAYVTSWGFNKGQKHQMLAPHVFMYRVADAKKPGPVLMKYWWTLGCFPTGLGHPFRLDEFIDNYIREHVPIEVEEWLNATLRAPVDSIATNATAAVRAIEAMPAARRSLLAQRPVLGVKAVHEPLQRAMLEFGVDVPPVAVRMTLERPVLRTRLANALHDLSTQVVEGGSTAHRRWTRELLNADADASADVPSKMRLPAADEAAALAQRSSAAPTASHDSAAPEDAEQGGPTHAFVAHAVMPPGLSARSAGAIGVAVSPDDITAEDERLAMETLTTLAAGAQRGRRSDVASKLLKGALRLAHDDETEAIGRTNYAAALIGEGRFTEAAAEAQEAVLLLRSPRAYATWATATAYADDYEKAGQIIDDALAVYPDDATLGCTADGIARVMCGRVTAVEAGQNRRAKTPLQFAAGTDKGVGVAFGHDFDPIRLDDKGNLTTRKLDARQGGLGSESRRVGALGRAPLMPNMEGH